MTSNFEVSTHDDKICELLLLPHARQQRRVLAPRSLSHKWRTNQDARAHSVRRAKEGLGHKTSSRSADDLADCSPPLTRNTRRWHHNKTRDRCKIQHVALHKKRKSSPRMRANHMLCDGRLVRRQLPANGYLHKLILESDTGSVRGGERRRIERGIAVVFELHAEADVLAATNHRDRVAQTFVNEGLGRQLAAVNVPVSMCRGARRPAARGANASSTRRMDKLLAKGFRLEGGDGRWSAGKRHPPYVNNFVS